jgi:hypothetical protein
MKKEELKNWLKLDYYHNNLFIRRIGIPQYQLIKVLEVADLQNIKEEFASTMRADDYIIKLSRTVNTAQLDTIIKSLYIADTSVWRNTIFKLVPDIVDIHSWDTQITTTDFFRNVRIYIRRKIANSIIQNRDVVYTMSKRLWLERVHSRFVTDWRLCPQTKGFSIGRTPLFFVEEDYAGRLIFMAGLQHYAINLTQVQGIVELKAMKDGK